MMSVRAGSPSLGVRLGSAATFLVAYAVAIAGLMMVNVKVISENYLGWGGYWILWAAFYAPAALAFALQAVRHPWLRASLAAYLGRGLVVTLAALEVSFLLDLHFGTVVVELAGLLALSWVLLPSPRASVPA